MKIFVNYRRLDNAYGSGRIYDRLKYEYGIDNVIKDIDTIPLGKDFREYIRENIISSNVVISIIGQNWLTIKDESTGIRRIDGNSDYVRIELELAFENNISVIPVFLDGLSNVDSKQLPLSIEKLSFINGISVRPDPDFDKDIDRLIRRIKEFEVIQSMPASPASEFTYNRDTGSILLNKPIQLELIKIPEGEYIAGRMESSSLGEWIFQGTGAYGFSKWRSAHKIHVKEFYIGKFPITNAQYIIFCRETGTPLPIGWNTDILQKKANHPMVNITWHNAKAFCHWLSSRTKWYIRLPTEDEWEKAARGTDGRNFPWGNTFDHRKANFKESGINATTSVDKYTPDSDSPYGVSDMAGNVWEWTEERYIYPSLPYTISEPPDGWLLKGGSFFREHVAMYFRIDNERDKSASNFGFRIVLDR